MEESQEGLGSPPPNAVVTFSLIEHVKEMKGRYTVNFPYRNLPLKTLLQQHGVVPSAGGSGYEWVGTVEALASMQSQARTLARVYVKGEISGEPPKESTRANRLPPVQQQAVQQLEETLVRRQYAYSTRKSYSGVFRAFLQQAAGQDPAELSQADIESYLFRRAQHDQISESYQNTLINAIKFYYEQVLGRERCYYDIARPQKHEPLPRVLSRQEVAAMIMRTKNSKHRCLLMLLYGMGLRLSEVLALLPSDINAHRMTVLVRRAKGKKDRLVPLPSRILTPLRNYHREHEPITYLFEGQTPGEPYSPRSVQLVVKQAARRAGIQRPVTSHMLRHSYATHLLEAGTDIRYIQEVLGHTSIKTTERYTHVARTHKPVSPLDNLLAPDKALGQGDPNDQAALED